MIIIFRLRHLLSKEEVKSLYKLKDKLVKKQYKKDKVNKRKVKKVEKGS